MVSSLQRRWSQLKHQASPISVEGGRLLFTILGKSNGKFPQPLSYSLQYQCSHTYVSVPRGMSGLWYYSM